MSMAAWVCFDCRVTVSRTPTYDGEVPCPECGRPTLLLGCRIPIPRKRDDRGWRALKAFIAEKRSEGEWERHRREVRSRHDLEQRIAELEARPPSSGLDRLIRELKQQLDNA